MGWSYLPCSNIFDFWVPNRNDWVKNGDECIESLLKVRELKVILLGLGSMEVKNRPDDWKRKLTKGTQRSWPSFEQKFDVYRFSTFADVRTKDTRRDSNRVYCGTGWGRDPGSEKKCPGFHCVRGGVCVGNIYKQETDLVRSRGLESEVEDDYEV